MIVDEISELFTLLGRFDIAAAHAPGLRTFHEHGISDAFYDLNSGVIAYRWSWRMRAFLARWRRRYEQVAHEGGDDQRRFRYCLWHSRLRLCVLPSEYNYRTRPPGYLRYKAKVLHGRPPDWTKVIETVNARVGQRTFDSFELPPSGRSG